MPGIEDLSLTTNGYLLERDADALVEAGITRVNVSIDSLQQDRFFQITRRDSLPQVLRGLEAIARHERVRPIKVNAVALRGFTEEEAIPFAEFARSTSFQVRFIEFMPLDGDHAWSRDQVLTGEELRAIIDAVHPLEEAPREPHATARVFRFADGAGEIGFINPVSEPFCADCNRIRLTADGKLRTCLFSLHETDLREPLRAGASDAELETRDPRGRLAQGAEAPRRRAGLPAAGADDVRDRWLSYSGHRPQPGAKVRKERYDDLDEALAARRADRGELAEGAASRPVGGTLIRRARAGPAGGRAHRAGRAGPAARRRRRARRRLERGVHRARAAAGWSSSGGASRPTTRCAGCCA